MLRKTKINTKTIKSQNEKCLKLQQNLQKPLTTKKKKYPTIIAKMLFYYHVNVTFDRSKEYR